MPPGRKLIEKKVDEFKHYKDKDFHKQERIIKLAMFALEPGGVNKLTDYELRLYEEMEKCYNLLMTSANKLDAANKYKKMRPELTTREAIELMNDTETVYGQVVLNDKKFQQQKIVSKAWGLYEQCIEKEEFYTANFVLRTIAEVQGVGKDNEIEDFFKNLELPEVSFTSDPRVLKIGEVEEAQEMDEEE